MAVKRIRDIVDVPFVTEDGNAAVKRCIEIDDTPITDDVEYTIRVKE